MLYGRITRLRRIERKDIATFVRTMPAPSVLVKSAASARKAGRVTPSFAKVGTTVYSSWASSATNSRPARRQTARDSDPSHVA